MDRGALRRPLPLGPDLVEALRELRSQSGVLVLEVDIGAIPRLRGDPFDYASFEGVIPPKQYGAGEVIVWDCGVYSPDEGKLYAFGDRDAAQ